MQQADRIVLGIIGAEAVGANHLGEAVGLMRRRRSAAAPHLAHTHPMPGFGELPGSFATGQAASDDLDFE